MKFSLFTIANLLTLVRALSIPALSYCIINHLWGIALVLFSVAIITDIFDGMIARILRQQSTFGALFDHITDKVFMITTISTLLATCPPLLPTWFCILSLTREILMALFSGILFITGYLATIKPLRMSNGIMATQTLMLWWLIAAQVFLIPFYNQAILLVTACILINIALHMVAGLKIIKKS